MGLVEETAQEWQNHVATMRLDEQRKTYQRMEAGWGLIWPPLLDCTTPMRRFMQPTEDTPTESD